MAKIVRFHRPGGPEVLQIEDIRVADPQEGEVRIRVEAVGLNRAEAVYREGYHWMQPELPSLIGYEASGVVEKIGPGVTGFSVGDYVSSIPAFSMCKYGTYGEAAVLPAYALTSCPPNL
jgi:NADPH2:quinone reductase